MSLGTARVAPEEAVFRPALPLHFLQPEFTGGHMTTYREQYLHPAWQKKRLEVMEEHGFSCAACGTTEKTLHVHHRRYVKGRKVWEYENDDLTCLCEDCHAIGHVHKSAIEQELARFEAFEGPTVHALLAGFRNAIPSGPDVPPGMADVTLFEGEEVQQAFSAGEVAHTLVCNFTQQEVTDMLFVLRHSESFLEQLPQLKAIAERELDARVRAANNQPLDDLDFI